MTINLVFIIIFLCSFCFILFQCFEFVQNYDYIINFNKKYNKYEFLASPSFSYVDKSLVDPNDTELNVKKKWRCMVYNDKWYGVSNQGMVLKNNDYGIWDSSLECINYVFENYYINYNNPCSIGSNNYCLILTSFNI